MVFFDLFSTGISCIFYGFVATAAIMAILYAVLRAISKGFVQSIPFFITGIVLSILLVLQFSLMFGAFEARSLTKSTEIYLSQKFENQYGTIGKQDSQIILDDVNKNFPIIGSYIGYADFSGNDISQVAELMAQTMSSYLSSYIWHRVWWIIGIIIVACFIAVCFEKKEYVPSSYEDNYEIYTEDYM